MMIQLRQQLTCFQWLQKHLVGRRRRRRRRRGTNNNKVLGICPTDLPDEIAINILSRLPLGCILNLQTVCKKWLALTSSQYFAETHFKRVGINSQISKDGQLDLFLFDKESERYKLVKIMPNGFIKLTSDVSPILVGSSNGLLVFQILSLGSPRHLVWDLLSRESVYIPAAPADVVSSVVVLSLSAILFHPSNQGYYKLLFSTKIGGGGGGGGDSDQYRYEFFIYESRNRSWRKLSTSSYPPTNSIDQAVVNPTIYKSLVLWMAPTDMEDPDDIPHCRSSVVIFNTDAEDFHCMPHPGEECCSWRSGHKHMYFFESKGQLYFCHNCTSGIVMWSLELYENWYWVKRYEVKHDCYMKKVSSVFFPCKRCYWYQTVKLIKIEGDAVFFRCRNRGLFKYDWRKKTVTKLDRAWRDYYPLLSDKSVSSSNNKFTYSDSSLSLDSGFTCRTSRGPIHGATI